MSRSVLRQFLLATLLVATYWLLRYTQSYHSLHMMAARYGPLPIAMLKWLPDILLSSLTISAAVAVGLVPMGAGAFRQGALLVGGVTLCFVLVDTVLGPAKRSFDRWATSGDSAWAAQPQHFADTTGTLGGVIALLAGKVRPEDAQAWPPRADTDRSQFIPIEDGREAVLIVAALKFSALTIFFLPALGAGLVLGLGAWLRRAVTFRTPRDERIFRLISAWFVVLGANIFLLHARASLYPDAGSALAWITWYILPLLIVGFPAAMGWRAAYRLDRLGAE